MRLFIGVDLPTEIKQALLDLQSELKRKGIHGSFKSQDNFHITIEFLGELEEESGIPVLTEILAKVVRNHKPFDLNIVGLGAFPSFKRPHTLWTAVKGSLTELNRLRDDLHHALKNEGFKLEERQFKPHITLASRPKLEDIDLSGLQVKSLGGFMVDEVVLFESRAVGGKRVYIDLYRAGFGL